MAEFTNSSSETPLPIAGQPYCRRLRCKEMFVEIETPLHPAQSGSGIYWCNHTQNCLGPDGEVADVENCKPGRTCYEEF
jgi:hypothetical protein